MTDAAAPRVPRAFLAACLLCVLPLLVVGYPVMVDIPQHAAQIAAILGTLDGSWRFAPEFQVQAFTPYWFGYGLVLALAGVIGVPAALKCVIGASVVAFPWSAARLLTRYGVPAAWFGWLLPLSLGFAFQWGFLSFIVAMPLAFLFLSHWRSLCDRRDLRSALMTALWLHLLFFAHLLIAAFVIAIATLQCVAGPRSWREVARRVAPLASILPLALVWAWMTLRGSTQAHEATVWKIGLGRLSLLLPDLVAAPPGAAGLLLGVVALAFPWATGARWRREPARWLPFAFFVAFVMLFPLYVSGNAHTASRFAAFGLTLYFLCFAPRADATDVPGRVRLPWALLTGVLGVALVGWHSLRASITDLEARGYRDVVSGAAPGGRMLSLVVEPRGYGSYIPYFLHYPAWYQATARGLVEPSFARSYAIPLQYRPGVEVPVDLGFAWVPETLDWNRHRGARYDYLVVRSADDPTPWLMHVSGCAVRPIRHSGKWWLFARAPRAGCDSAPPARGARG